MHRPTTVLMYSVTVGTFINEQLEIQSEIAYPPFEGAYCAMQRSRLYC